MKSKSTTFILILVVLLVVAALVYFFVIKKDTTTTAPSLVSTNTGQSTSLVNQSGSSTGSQVVEILRNLTVIKLDDAVFRNPAFNQLSDMSIALPPIVNQGRRNPFAPAGSDYVAPVVSTQTGPSL